MTIPREYSGSDVRLTFDGELLTEFIDGEFLSLSFTEDDTTSSNGANGATAVSYKHNKIMDMTLTLMQVSPDNDLVDAKVSAILLARHGHIDVVVVDGRGGNRPTVVTGKAVPKKRADVKFATEAGPREWAFSLHVDEYVVGGNQPA